MDGTAFAVLSFTIRLVMAFDLLGIVAVIGVGLWLLLRNRRG